MAVWRFTWRMRCSDSDVGHAAVGMLSQPCGCGPVVAVRFNDLAFSYCQHTLALEFIDGVEKMNDGLLCVLMVLYMRWNEMPSRRKATL